MIAWRARLVPPTRVIGAIGSARVVRYGLVLLALTLAASILQRVELALEAAHGPGEVSGGVGDLAGPARLFSPERAIEVARGWSAFDPDMPDLGVHLPSVGGLTTAYFLADLLLIGSLVTLLVMLQHRAWRLRDDKAPPQVTANQDPAIHGSRIATYVYLFADLAETERATQHWDGLGATGAHLIAAASAVKWLALMLAVLPLVVDEARRRQAQLLSSASSSGLSSSGKLPTRSPGLIWALRSLRGQLLVVLLLVLMFLALRGDLGLQIDDVLIRASERPYDVISALLATVLTGATLAAGGWWCAHAYLDSPPVKAISVPVLAALGAGSVVGLLLGFLPHLGPSAWNATRHVIGLLAAAGLLLAMTSFYESVRKLSAPAAPVPPENERALRKQLRALLPVLAVTPLGVLILAVLRAAVSQWAAGSTPKGLLLWAALIAVLIPALLLGAWVAVPRLAPRPGLRQFVSGSVHALAVGVVAFLVPMGPASRLGATTVVMLFAAWLAFTVAMLIGLGDRFSVRGSPALLGVRRVPIVSLVVLLGLAASLTDQDGVYYDVVDPVALAEDQAPADPVDAQGLVTDWLRQHAAPPARPATPGPAVPVADRGQVPLLFVATAGGGIKAAYWTAAGWSCVLGTTCGSTQDLTGQVFLASGVSGGSLGLAAVDARSRDPRGDAGTALTRKGSTDGAWYDRALSDDFVAPSVAAFLFRDLPNAVLRMPFSDRNRAAALQSAWQDSMPALGLPFYPVTGRPTGAGPALVLNGVSAEDGCRLATATVSLGPGGPCSGDLAGKTAADAPRAYPTRDTRDYLCTRQAAVRRNIPLSAAALLSARFPYVSPSGDLIGCDTERPRPHTYALDGGLYDNSAGTAVSQAWEQVAATVQQHNQDPKAGACVVPRLLVLDNHYDPQSAPAAAHRPQQSSAPAAAIAAVYDLRSQIGLGRAEQVIRDGAAAAGRDCHLTSAQVQDPVAVIRPVQRPGSKAPLGWTLSRWSRIDMSVQLQAKVNREQADRVRGWFVSS
jgi:hypothetical protein